VAESICDECHPEQTHCSSCSTRCTTHEPDTDCLSCFKRQVIFKGDDTVKLFCKWLFNESRRGSIVIAHNGRGYDYIFLHNYLLENFMYPTMTKTGTKIMYMHVKQLDIKFIDSFSFLPMALKKLPKTLGLSSSLKKGDFPHTFNTRENFNQRYFDTYPALEHYGDSVDAEWYNSLRGPYDMHSDMEQYCKTDVVILRDACLTFRQLIRDVTAVETDDGVQSVDPFSHVTIASTCMQIYRQNFLKEYYTATFNDQSTADITKVGGIYYHDGQEIPEGEILDKVFSSSDISHIPSQGYTARENHSLKSIQWLEYLSHTQKVFIQHARNIGEYSLGKYKVDGRDENGVIYEFYGCRWHSCPDCYPGERRFLKDPYNRLTMDALYRRTVEREQFLKENSPRLVTIWECQYDKLLSTDKDMAEFVSSLDLPARLVIRDSFYGGRVNATKLHYKVEGDEKIHYYDFTSLYPYVNKYKRLPLGHPEIITKDFDYSFESYFGIAKIKFLPPRGLYHPVLPYRSNGRLMFPLCRTCVEALDTNPCQCTDQDRAMIGTYCTPEINKAIEKGYTILRVYEVYHWKESSDQLFSEYVNTFLRIKQEASGYPAWVKTEDDRDAYIQQYKEAEGISLRKERIAHNPGLRTVAKLALNSFWGKFGEKPNQTKSSYITDPVQFKRMANDPSTQIVMIHMVNEDCLLVETKKASSFEEDNLKTNEVVASFTTCWARLELYRVMEFLDRRVLYTDTDSVLFTSRDGQPMPPLGDFLGQLTSEVPHGSWIEEFISSGPKSYSYRLNDGKEEVKFKGVMMTPTNRRLVNFDSIQEVVTRGLVIRLPTFTMFVRDKIRGQIFNRSTYKTVQRVYTKRVLLDNYDTLPYGY
jgi:hypothetical protein